MAIFKCPNCGRFYTEEIICPYCENVICRNATQAERIKELKDYLLEFGGHKKGCLANIAKEHCNCGFEQALKGE